jgi:hypothetical protein
VRVGLTGGSSDGLAWSRFLHSAYASCGPNRELDTSRVPRNSFHMGKGKLIKGASVQSENPMVDKNSLCGGWVF